MLYPSRLVALAASALLLLLGALGPSAGAVTLPPGGGGPAAGSQDIPNVRNVSFANVPMTGTRPAVNGQVSLEINLGSQYYDPCNSGSEPSNLKQACIFGGGSYYHVTQGSMSSPNGIFIPNVDPPNIVHNWANKVFDARV